MNTPLKRTLKINWASTLTHWYIPNTSCTLFSSKSISVKVLSLWPCNVTLLRMHVRLQMHSGEVLLRALLSSALSNKPGSWVGPSKLLLHWELVTLSCRMLCGSWSSLRWGSFLWACTLTHLYDWTYLWHSYPSLDSELRKINWASTLTHLYEQHSHTTLYY